MLGISSLPYYLLIFAAIISTTLVVSVLALILWIFSRVFKFNKTNFKPALLSSIVITVAFVAVFVLFLLLRWEHIPAYPIDFILASLTIRFIYKEKWLKCLGVAVALLLFSFWLEAISLLF